MKPKIALAVGILLIFAQIGITSAGEVKNVILLIGDGMGFPQLHITELVYGNLTMEHFNWTCVGFELTDSLSGEVTDSAAAGTAIATGFKTYNGMISTLKLNNKTVNLTTILEVAERINKSTGLVTTARITDATPAVFASHVKNRHMENVIARQLIEHRVNVLLGGGAKYFDEKTLKLAKKYGYVIVHDKKSLERAKGKYILGLFAKSNIPFVLDRSKNIPSLLDMTKKAIEVLEKNPNGFFLMVEGGRIDHACHINDIASVVAETKEFDDVVKYVLNYAKHRGDTVVIVTADHETGGLAVGITYGKSVKVKDILKVKKSVEYMAKEIRSGKSIEYVVKKYAGIELSPEEVKRIKEAEKEKYGLEDTLGEIISEKMGVKFATHKHTGSPVPLMVYGSDEFKGGFLHHVATSKIIAKLMLFDRDFKVAKLARSKIKGDANGDGIVNEEDAYIALMHVGNVSGAYKNIDMDGNGIIDYNDVCLILSKAYANEARCLSMAV